MRCGPDLLLLLVLIFRKWSSHIFEIYVMDSDGSNIRNLSNHTGTDYAPSWSPDGSQIVFNSDRDGARDIFIMDEDGSNVRNLTNHSEDDYIRNYFLASIFF